jgi:hypothetical protein
MGDVVKVSALRAAATAMEAEGGPITYLENAKDKLEQAHLGMMSLSVLGISTVNAHNNALAEHVDNLKGGIGHLHAAAEALRTSASNWDKSDQPWVVKD